MMTLVSMDENSIYSKPVPSNVDDLLSLRLKCHQVSDDLMNLINE